MDNMDKVDKMDKEPLIPKHGGYRHLKSFQLARVVYDVTVRFCGQFIERKSRTHDQMVQAARSGVQNIAEGSQASGTSRKSELKLTNVARASMEELRLDYEDFLRQRGLEIWERDDARRQSLIDRRPQTADDVAKWVKQVSGWSGRSGHNGRSGPSGQAQRVLTASTGSIASTLPTPSVEECAANAAIALINVACFLLDRQLAAQSKTFISEGGFTERLYQQRVKARIQN